MVTTSPEIVLHSADLKRAAQFFRAINHALRQQLLATLDKNGKMTVTQLYCELNLEQSVASQHLAVLRKAGLVQASREGKNVLYALNYARVKQIHHLAENLLKGT